MRCNNESHDHTETNNGVIVDPMVCGHCGDRLHYDEGAKDYIHDDQEKSCWLHQRAFCSGIEGASPCTFDVLEVLESVLPEGGNEVEWNRATARETSDLLNNLRDGFSEFWGVNV